MKKKYENIFYCLQTPKSQVKKNYKMKKIKINAEMLTTPGTFLDLDNLSVVSGACTDALFLFVADIIYKNYTR